MTPPLCDAHDRKMALLFALSPLLSLPLLPATFQSNDDTHTDKFKTSKYTSQKNCMKPKETWCLLTSWTIPNPSEPGMREVFELMEIKSVGLTGRSVIRTTTWPGSAFGTGFVTNTNPAKGSFASKFCCSIALLLIFFSLGEPTSLRFSTVQSRRLLITQSNVP